MAEVKILYEDKDIIVVVKPAGMASQEERSADMDMVSWLKNYLVREKKVKGMPSFGQAGGRCHGLCQNAAGGRKAQ